MNQTSLVLASLIGLAGALGAISRYLLGRWMTLKTGGLFPWGTLLINLSGAFLIGLLTGLAGRKLLNPPFQTIATTGFLGGYTTFSTLSWEGTQLLKGGQRRQGVLYLAGSYLPGLLAVARGLSVGGLL